jgi:hypothetical protein
LRRAYEHLVNEIHTHLAPTNQIELDILLTGNCPSCGDNLNGDNRDFCIVEQYWWHFKPGMTFA